MDDLTTTNWSLKRGVVGAVMISVIVGCGCSNAASTASTVEPTTATSVVATTSSPATPASAASIPVSDVLVTVAGPVTGIFPGGDLTLNDDGTDYRILMTSPKIVDVNGAEVSRDAIKMGESVQIIGTVSDKTIAAQSVIVPAEPARSTETSAA